MDALVLSRYQDSAVLLCSVFHCRLRHVRTTSNDFVEPIDSFDANSNSDAQPHANGNDNLQY